MNRLRLYRHSASDRVDGRVRVSFCEWVGAERAREWTLEIRNRPVNKFGNGRARTHPLIRKRREWGTRHPAESQGLSKEARPALPSVFSMGQSGYSSIRLAKRAAIRN